MKVIRPCAALALVAALANLTMYVGDARGPMFTAVYR